MKMSKKSKLANLRFPPDLRNTLRSYVYFYTDPRNGEPFYVGRGRGNRAFSHLDAIGETEKIARIAAIRKSGKQPKIDLLRYGMTSEESSLVEAAVIDFVGLAHLTNEVSGNHKTSSGRISSKDLITMLTARPAKIKHRTVLIIINRLYRSEMTAGELYEATRGIWKIGPKRDKAELAMAVYQGIVREVYRIKRWLPAGTQKYETRDSRGFKSSGRWEFEGEIANDLRDQYVDLSVRHLLGKKSQNPIRYSKGSW
jgi:hypothetical protein